MAPSTLRPEIPPWIDELVMRMLRPLPGLRAEHATDPARHFASMKYVIDALRRRSLPAVATEASVAFAEPPRQRSDEMREATIIEQLRWLQARIAAAETKSETLQRLNVDLTSQVRRLREKTLPRRTLIAGAVGIGIGIAVKWAGDFLYGSTNANSPLRNTSYAAPELPLPLATPQPLVATVAADAVTSISLAPDVALDQVYVPPGPFLMGSTPENEKSQTDELPQQAVDLAEFWIGRTEITVAQFAAFVRATGHRTQAQIDGRSMAWIDNGAK
ncbi:MAG: SUMF1/EgtB/PvdO family nonheme iron enzyme [Chloroflexi bacterium]|nr:SUMF1/EgtB/PvdO family nonheme iron enzyme [Chloroflexota bacterium]